MDFLDSNLHADILNALASNLASSSQQDDLALLTDSFSSLEPVTTGLINGVLNRLAPSSFLDDDESPQLVTVEQANSIVAFAEYSAQTEPSLENVKRVVVLLHALPTWEVETWLGTQASQDWALPDQLAYSLAASLLQQLARGAGGDRTTSLRTLAEVQQAVLDRITTAPGYRVVSHLLPVLNGTRRALATSSFPWEFTDPLPAAEPTERNFITVLNAVNQEYDVGTAEGRVSLATLRQYQSSAKGFSPGMLTLAALEGQVVFVAGALGASWAELVEGPLKNQAVFGERKEFVQKGIEALALFATTVKAVEVNGEGGDPYTFDILPQALICATLFTVASGSLNHDLLATLEALLSEASPLSEETIQLRAVESLNVLLNIFPSTTLQVAKTVRRFVLSPALPLESSGGYAASTTLRAAAKCYAKAIKASHDTDAQVSAVQSLFNYFTPPLANAQERAATYTDGSAPRSEGQLDAISANVAHVVSGLAQALGDVKTRNVAASMLLQKLSGTHAVIDGAVMYELAELAEVVDVPVFNDIAQRFSIISKSPTSEQVSKAVLVAQTRLAKAAAGRAELHQPFVIALLSLFVDQGTADDGAKGVQRAERAQSLLELIPVLDTFFSTANLDADRKVDQSEIVLFRNLWYLFVLSGFLSTASRLSEWQRAALVRIARATPCLLANAKHDFVETDLEYDYIFRKKTHVLSPETVKSELTTVPQLAGATRSLSVPQAVFLTAVLRLESMRAEAGVPSVMLSYFQVDGINNGPIYNALAAIAHSVNQTFIHHFGRRVVAHSIDTSVYGEVRAILLQCCHQYERVRSVSIRYLSSLVSSFPSLICEASVVCALLEVLTVLRQACQAEFIDEYTPTYSFPSLRGKFTLVLPDDYAARNEILTDLHKHIRNWLNAAITRAPLEMQGLLQDYINGSPSMSSSPYTTSHPGDEMGKSVAIDLIRMLPVTDRAATLPKWGGWKADNSAQFAKTFASRSFFGGSTLTHDQSVLSDVKKLRAAKRPAVTSEKLAEWRSVMFRAASVLIATKKQDADLLQDIVAVPFRFLAESTMVIGQEVWTWIADARPDLEVTLMVEITEQWLETIKKQQGLFSSSLNRQDPLDQETKFTPTDKDAMLKEFAVANRLLQPHCILLSFVSSRFQAFRYRSKDLVLACMLLVYRSVQAVASWSTHALARELRMRLVTFGFVILQGSLLESAVEAVLRGLLYDAALSWFAIRPSWTYGSNRIQLKSDLQAVEELFNTVKNDTPTYGYFVTSLQGERKLVSLPGRASLQAAKAQQLYRHGLLVTFLENEADRIKLWMNPLLDSTRGPLPSASLNTSEPSLRQLVRRAWVCKPEVAIHLPERLKHACVTAEVTKLVRADPWRVQDCAEALQFFIGETIPSKVRSRLRVLLYWKPVPVVFALRFLFPKFGGDPILLQYALRVLEHHPVEVTFFYIPQVVQALRTDALGYAERFIFETSKISQLFCHQIIWNMKANAYRGDAGEEPDPMKPTLDRMVEMIVDSLSGEAKDFFQREFTFFDEVTSISAKLKPFIKASKPEKKAKIDREMAKIKVDPGVYLPSNPDGVVVDIDRHSGRPLQSHAKAPFMATFKVHREYKKPSATDHEVTNALIAQEEANQDAADVKGFDTWQSAIFKVGDDCRQDVLALQIIAMHKNIFTCLGLDLLVTPYRVTATGPGCGVIDVVPNATSRDEMGRAKVNDLKTFFVNKYGDEHGVHFQKARTNFIQSMAAYSLLCYILQIKDRHNGNIMIDGRGCITHIDFGFLFDIDESSAAFSYIPCSRANLPGVKFEPNSFKLSHEMIVLMGGKDSHGYRAFQELTVKAFLACRPYGQAVVDTTALMLASEFPSFKGEPTIQRLRDRFRLDLSEKDAADYMKSVIANACENLRSIVYDQFQRSTNGIPYVR